MWYVCMCALHTPHSIRRVLKCAKSGKSLGSRMIKRASERANERKRERKKERMMRLAVAR